MTSPHLTSVRSTRCAVRCARLRAPAHARAAAQVARPVAAARPPARLLHHRRVVGAVLATIDDNGVIHLLRLATADHPELARLTDADRATLSAAVMALQRIEGGPRDAA